MPLCRRLEGHSNRNMLSHPLCRRLEGYSNMLSHPRGFAGPSTTNSVVHLVFECLVKLNLEVFGPFSRPGGAEPRNLQGWRFKGLREV